ncbi:MAG: serine hydrolase [Bernardetiaceae bacterium]|jgi:CubicO group peptidase (beta-lactamase class C family)|nr:serine hydrolase [Bernardetiaceae bacterium]
MPSRTFTQLFGAALVALAALQTPALAQKKPLADLDAFMERNLAAWKVPGAAVVIVSQGQVIWLKGYGQRHLGQGLPVTPQTVFPIASCTKAFTTTALGILADEGKLDWDAPARTYAPDLQLADDYVTAHLTPRDMACHRSGLPRHDLVWYAASLTRAELFARLRYLPPSKPFRTVYQYNNHMFMALGVLVERISGQPWETFVRQRITEPLGMTNTVFSYPEMLQKANYALSYAEVNGHPVEQSLGSNVDVMGPTGGIKSTAEDLGHWLLLQLQRGKHQGKTIVSEAQWQNTHTPHVVVPGELKYEEYSYGHYGLGWRIDDYRDHLRVLHNGAIEGYRAQITLFPRQNFGVAILTNTSAAEYYFVNTVSNYVADQLLGIPPVDWSARLQQERAEANQKAAKAKAAPDTVRVTGTQPGHSLTSYAGTYAHPAYGKIKVQVFENRLQANYRSFQMDLNHYHFEVFEAVNNSRFDKYKFQFITNAQGKVDKLTVPLEPALGAGIEFSRQ